MHTVENGFVAREKSIFIKLDIQIVISNISLQMPLDFWSGGDANIEFANHLKTYSIQLGYM